MKRLILAAVAASVLAAPMAQAAPFATSVGTPTVKSDVVQVAQKHVVKKKIVVKRMPHRVTKKVVVRKHWKNGQRYSDWRRHQAVNDWRRYGLRDPGHGREWIRVGNEYLLVSIASGIIAGIIAAQH